MQAVEVADREHAPLERLLERPAAPHDAHPLSSRPRERPPLKTLWRHYAARFARAFAASLFILTLLVIAVDTLLELDEIPEDERTLAAAALRVGLRTLAQYFAYLVPAASFTAAFVTVAQGARAREIVALKAGGVNPLVAFLPVFVAAMAAGFALALVQETAGVRAAGALAGRTGAMRGELTRSGAIWYNAGRVIYSARESDPEGERVADIHVLERDMQGHLLRQIHAERAVRLSPQLWRFENAVVRSFDPSSPTTPPRFERAKDITLPLASDRTPRLHPDELAALTLPTLGDYVSVGAQRGRQPGSRALRLPPARLGPRALPALRAARGPARAHGRDRRRARATRAPGRGVGRALPVPARRRRRCHPDRWTARDVAAVGDRRPLLHARHHPARPLTTLRLPRWDPGSLDQ